MRKLLAAVFTMAICSVKAQTPIVEAFNLDWKIIPARLNINTLETNVFTALNYRDSRVEISSTEQALMVKSRTKKMQSYYLRTNLK